MFITVLVFEGIVPFGDKTFLMFDLKRQYVDYYSYYKTILSGENNIFYSFSTTLGSGIIGFIAYYLTSPLLLVTVLFPQSSMPLAVTIIIGLKLMLAAFFMDLFLLEHVSSKNPIGVLICSVSWAFSGFLFAHSMNMMWTDVVIMVPVLIHFLEKHLGEDRRVPYILTLAFMLILNYYITYQVLIFIGLWTIMRIYVMEYDRPVTRALRVIGSTILSGLISSVLLIPTAIELINSPKDIAAKGFVLNGYNLTLIDILSKLPTLAYDEQEPFFGYPQLFIGVLLIFLILMFFMSSGIKRREKIGMFVMLAIFAVSFCRDFVNVLWHAGMEPQGHPYRQAYLCVFVMIFCGCRAFEYLKDEISLVRVLASCGIICVGLYFIRNGMYDHISDRTMMANYALVAFYTVCLALCVVVRKEQARFFEGLLVIILLANMADLGVTAIFTYNQQSMLSTPASEYTQQVGDNLKVMNGIKEMDDSFYRMETLHPRQQNDSSQYAYNGITHYSSAGLTYVRNFLQRLGFNDDELHTNYGHDNTAVSDSILGIKYVVSDGTYNVHPQYNRIIEGEVGAYENPYALSVAVGTDGFDLADISDPVTNYPDVSLPHVPRMDPFSLQEDIYSRLLGKEVSLFTDCVFEQSDLYESEGKYIYDYEATATADGEMYVYFDGLIGARESLSVFVDGEFLTTYGNASCVKILNLGEKKAGDKVLVSVQAEDTDSDFGRAVFVTEDTAALKAAYEEVSRGDCVVKKLSSSHITIDTGDYEGVFVTVPYQKGWRVRVDGKEITPVAIYDSLTYIPIDNKGSEHHIDMSFTTVGIRFGFVLTLIGLAFMLRRAFTEKNMD
jgi:uncharacterized membrane protein YfhO